MFLAGCLNGNGKDAEKTVTVNNPRNLFSQEAAFVEFKSQFKEFPLPLSLGSIEFEDEGAFPSEPVLERGSRFADDLYQELAGAGEKLVALGRLPDMEGNSRLLVLALLP